MEGSKIEVLMSSCCNFVDYRTHSVRCRSIACVCLKADLMSLLSLEKRFEQPERERKELARARFGLMKFGGWAST